MGCGFTIGDDVVARVENLVGMADFGLAADFVTVGVIELKLRRGY